MLATDYLKKQHTIVAQLFEKIEKASSASAKQRLFGELASCLAAHDAIEREIFYPACEQQMGMTSLLGEALVEHGVIEFSLYLASEAGADDFGFKLEVLRENVEHHVKEEEEELFPKVEKALGAKRLTALCAEMETRFEQARAKDFRLPLHENLRQVLKGAMEPLQSADKTPTRTGVIVRATKKPAGAAHATYQSNQTTRDQRP